MSERRYDEIGYWSEIKLDIVREYAQAYSTVLAKQTRIRKYLYIDAFAGAGVHISKQTGEFVPGSPLNALNVQPPFSEYHFIDLDGDKAEHLRQLAGDAPNVSVYNEDCNSVLLGKVFTRARYRRLSPRALPAGPLRPEPRLGGCPSSRADEKHRDIPELHGHGHEHECPLEEPGQRARFAVGANGRLLGRSVVAQHAVPEATGPVARLRLGGESLERCRRRGVPGTSQEGRAASPTCPILCRCGIRAAQSSITCSSRRPTRRARRLCPTSSTSTVTGGLPDGHELRHRMDRIHLEPGHRMHEDQPGCTHCYAERMAKRLQAMGQANYANGFKVAMHEHAVELPLTWKKPRDDLRQLDERPVPPGDSCRVHPAGLRRHAPGGLAPVPTSDQAVERLLELDCQLQWLPNIWMGVSVENQDYAYRIDHLRQTHAHTQVPLA